MSSDNASTTSSTQLLLADHFHLGFRRTSNPSNLNVIKLDDAATLPIRASKYDAGYDLYALNDGQIEPRGRGLVRTGISIRMPEFAAGQLKIYGSIRSRSGLSVKHGIEVGAGVIDFSYDKELCVVLYNHSDVLFQYSGGDRIAQLVLEAHVLPPVVQVEQFMVLVNNDRTGGFGSTGR